MNSSEPKIIAGRRLSLLKWIFFASMAKYALQKKKYPLFSWTPIHLIRTRRSFAMTKVVKLANRYYAAIMRVPHWPSRAFDRMIANGGFNIHAAGTPQKKQADSVILAITRKCPYNCVHCYEKPNLSEKESVPIQKWIEVIQTIQQNGANIVVLSGGEPLLRLEGVLTILEACDQNLSDFHIHTTGFGMTQEKAMALKKSGLRAAGISIDDFRPERHDSFRGYRGAYREAVHAIECFRKAGIYPYMNVCLHKDLIFDGGLWRLLQLSKELRVGSINLLEPKPCGGFASSNADALFSDEDRSAATDFFLTANRHKHYRDYPLVIYMPYFERPHRLGCTMGGLSHFYINSLGDLAPCVYLPVSFGNILEEDFSAIFKKMRQAVPFPLKKECPTICLAKSIETNRGQSFSSPVPFETIEKAWQGLFT
jgi:MoaA/NifB/PqqE/SkfB family radical SAM enzyme